MRGIRPMRASPAGREGGAMSTIATAPTAALAAVLPDHDDGGAPVALRYPTAGGGFPPQALAGWTAQRR